MHRCVYTHIRIHMYMYTNSATCMHILHACRHTRLILISYQYFSKSFMQRIPNNGTKHPPSLCTLTWYCLEGRNGWEMTTHSAYTVNIERVWEVWACQNGSYWLHATKCESRLPWTKTDMDGKDSPLFPVRILYEPFTVMNNVNLFIQSRTGTWLII